MTETKPESSTQKLDPSAYGKASQGEYQPFVRSDELPEFTLKSVATGIVLGMVFGAANVYLGLKAGLTISTSIPVAVLSVVAFRAIGWVAGGRGQREILELNMSQTIGSASSSVASGVLFTIPALFLWQMYPAWGQLTLLAIAGGLLGVLAMIPLRRYLIKQEHGKLPYPEGLACAEVLVAAEQGGSRASLVFWGIGLGVIFKFITSGLKLVGDKVAISLPLRSSLAINVSPALMGVGFILGPRIASVMVAGGALSSLVIIPCIYLLGRNWETPLYPETEHLIRDMASGELWEKYVRYIGAGAVATGGLLTLIRSLPTMIQSFRLGLQNLADSAGAGNQQRTNQDLPMSVVGLIALGVLLMLALVPGILGFLDSLVIRGLAALLIGICAFFFVTVSSRIVGLVGVTSNPTSGMTIATLLLTSLIFTAFSGQVDDLQLRATVLMVGTAVCIAASIAGDTSQDLKTGFLLGATPRKQQIGELLGVLTAAGVVCYVVQLLHNSTEGGLGGAELPAPQGKLMQLIIDGVLDGSLPWRLILVGVALAFAAAALRLPVLAFAVGVYLPLSTMAAVFAGGMLRWLMTRRGDAQVSEDRRERGVLVGSGLVGGEGLTGVLLAFWVVGQGGKKIAGLPFGLPNLLAAGKIPGWLSLTGSLVMVALILGTIYVLAARRNRDASPESTP